MTKEHPLEEENISRNVDPCILVIFGATGDLTGRKLLPALYHLNKDHLLPSNFACVGFARREKTHEVFREEMQKDIESFSRTKPVDLTDWESLKEKVFYHQSDFDTEEGYQKLAEFLKELDGLYGTKGNRVFYLSVQPKYFPIIIEKLASTGQIAKPNKEGPFTRVIIEKPFGRDTESAKELQQFIARYLDESQIYRIDHYLGKETVQNLLSFRFSNSIFEPVWNAHHIDHVQITVSEDIGIGTRGKFFEEEGLLRDIIQNHMMQLLSLVAMEPPVSLNADAIRNEKVKVLQAVRPIRERDFEEHIIRGQYTKGLINGEEALGYREEENVDAKSVIETYLAMRLHIDNWRWAGVPFYLRGGKRLPKRTTEIAILFKKAPGILFEQKETKPENNALVIRIQPNEGISLKINCKVPGPTSPVQPVNMDFRYGSYFGKSPPEAYERLILDCMIGDSTLFARSDEVAESWGIFTPLLQFWQTTPRKEIPSYAAGSWGPEEADALLQQDGRAWRLL